MFDRDPTLGFYDFVAVPTTSSAATALTLTKAPTGFALEGSTMSNRTATALAFVDVDAPTGPAPIALAIGDDATTAPIYSAPSALSIAARTPTTMTTGTATPIDVASAGASFLGKVQLPSGLQVVETSFHLTTNVPAGSNSAYWRLPASGHFVDAMERAVSSIESGTPASLFATASASAIHYVVADVLGHAGYGTSLRVDTTPAVGIALASPAPTTRATVQDLGATFPLVVQHAATDGTNTLWFKVTVDASAVGHVLRAVTGGGDTGDRRTDTSISILDGAGNVVAGPQDVTNAGEDLVSPKITAAGSYFVNVDPGFLFSATHASFELIVRVQ
jgi:hypothetical protein